MTTVASELVFEGCGGFRQKVALAALTCRPIYIKGIRENAETPGLRPCEGTVLELLERLSQDVAIDISESATEVRIDPGQLVGKDYVFTVECAKDRGLVYYLEFLAMICPFMKHNACINLEGVTDHPDDLSIDSFRTALTAYAGKIGLPSMSLSIERRGMLPDGGGLVQFSCGVLRTLDPFKLLYAGRIARVRGSVWTCHMTPIFATKTMSCAREVLNRFLADVHIYVEPQKGEKAGKSPGFGLALVAESMKGSIFVADGVVDKVDQDNERLDETEALGSRVAKRLVAEIAQGAAVDSSFQWLPLFFASVADDDKLCRVLLGPPTKFTLSLLKDIDRFLGVRFNVQTYQEVVEQASRRQEEVAEKAPSDDDATEAPESTRNDEVEAEELDPETLDEAKAFNIYQNTKRLVFSCRGIGITNLSRVTF